MLIQWELDVGKSMAGLPGRPPVRDGRRVVFLQQLADQAAQHLRGIEILFCAELLESALLGRIEKDGEAGLFWHRAARIGGRHWAPIVTAEVPYCNVNLMRTAGTACTAHTLRRMAARSDFANYCSELLSAVGDAQAKRMFGGWGLYIDGVFVAIVVGETLYLKTDDQTQERFVAAGGTRFEYTARGKQHSSGYWSVPPEAMDSPALMAPWARLALEAAVRAKAARAPKGRSSRPR